MATVREDSMRPPSAHTEPPPDTKCTAFDHYWETRDLVSLDLRTRLRVGIVERMLQAQSGDTPVAGKTMLDVGCGRGSVSAHFAELGYHVTAFDISPIAVGWTEKQHPTVRAMVLDLETEPIIGSYDVILCLEVLQQVREPVAVLTKLREALTPDGTLVVSLPNEFHLARRLSILTGRISFGGIEDTHIKLFTPREHHRLFEACGLAIDREMSQSIIPPRWSGGRWHHKTRGIASRWPGLLALSTVYALSQGQEGG